MSWYESLQESPYFKMSKPKRENEMIIDYEFKKEVSGLINRYNVDRELNCPDYAIADFLSDSLVALSLMEKESAKHRITSVPPKQPVEDDEADE